MMPARRTLRGRKESSDKIYCRVAITSDPSAALIVLRGEAGGGGGRRGAPGGARRAPRGGNAETPRFEGGPEMRRRGERTGDLVGWRGGASHLGGRLVAALRAAAATSQAFPQACLVWADDESEDEAKRMDARFHSKKKRGHSQAPCRRRGGRQESRGESARSRVADESALVENQSKGHGEREGGVRTPRDALICCLFISSAWDSAEETSGEAGQPRSRIRIMPKTSSILCTR